jgi:predicted nucleic acid-binding protein
MYLFDTNIISVLAPRIDQQGQDEAVYRWLLAVKQPLFLSVISITEMEAGIAKARRVGASAKADRLRTWLDSVQQRYAARILPLDLLVAQTTGKMLDKARGRGTTPGFEDTAIAATAARHGLTVVTRNVKHFEVFEIPLFNPYTGAA